MDKAVLVESLMYAYRMLLLLLEYIHFLLVTSQHTSRSSSVSGYGIEKETRKHQAS